MAGRLDPPHDRVILTPIERRMVADLERAYDERSAHDDAAASPDRTDTEEHPRGVRVRVSRVCRHALRVVAFLLPLGLFIVFALSFSGVASALGLAISGVAVVASLRWRRMRAPLRRLRRWRG
jgi:hypothetical protein